MKSNYNNRANSSRAYSSSNDKAVIGWTKTNTPADFLISFNKSIGITAGGEMKRAFGKYRTFMAQADYVPDGDLNGAVPARYDILASKLVEPWVTDDGKVTTCNEAVALAEARMTLTKILKDMHGCGCVNIILMGTAGGVTSFIDRGFGSKPYRNSTFDFTANGVAMSKEDTLTIVISKYYIRKVVRDSLFQANLNLNTSDHSTKDVSAIALADEAKRIRVKEVGKQIYMANLVAMYRDSNMSAFNYDVIVQARALKNGNDPIHGGNTKRDSRLPGFKDIRYAFTKTGANHVSPYSIMDLFTVKDSEVQTFLNSVFGSNLKTPSNSVNCASILHEPSGQYADSGSEEAANYITVARLNAAILFLMMHTTDSVPVYYVNKHIKAIKSRLNYGISTATNIAHGGLTNLIDTIEIQLDLMSNLLTNPINIDKYREELVFNINKYRP